MDTAVASFCGFVNHTLCTLIGLRGDCCSCHVSKELFGTQQRKCPVSLRVLCLWYSQPGLLTYETTWSCLPGRKVRLSPDLMLSASCHSVSHIHTQRGCKCSANSLPARKLSAFSQGEAVGNTEPARWSSGPCSRITSNSAFCFRWLSPLGKGVGRKAKGILDWAKLCLISYLEKLLILSPAPKDKKPL